MSDCDDLESCLDLLCPMHVLLDQSGFIRKAGPTLCKLRSQQDLIGRRFLDVFDLHRPRTVDGMDSLVSEAGTKLHLIYRTAPHTAFKGVLVPRHGGKGAIIDLSFGISVLEAVQDYALTNADFSVTDMTIEMLYLVEAKSAAMEASRSLNLRLQGAMIAAEEKAYTDTLTGLKNRRAMDHILQRSLQTASSFALMHLDLDFFKAVNDTKGHAAGDYVLQQVAQIMIEETRKTDTVARVGGDEFVLIIEGLHDRPVLERIAGRLINRLEEPMSFNGDVCRISASIGTTLYENGAQADAALMLHQADLALYAAKNAGRGRHTFFAPDMAQMPIEGHATH
ncbi:MAG: diguanylate cyclase domain-containing protein [Paracoccaceae bacterium]